MQIKTESFGVAVLLCCLCAAEDKVVVNKEFSFEIAFPQTWAVSEKTPEGFLARATSPLAEGAKTRAIVKVLGSNVRDGITAKSLGEALNDELPKRLKNYELVEKSEVKFNDMPAYKVSYLFDGVNTKDRLSGTVYLFVASNHGYQITTMSNKDDAPKYVKDIETILHSFKWKPAGLEK